MRLCYLSLILGVTVFSFSCNKHNSSNEYLFYGNWKTSYGDTIRFSNESGKNILTYDYSMNPLQPVDTKKEFTYQNNKLEINDGFSTTNDFRMLQSFSWMQQGKIFTVRGIEWFSFLSSTQTYFTFTKID